MPLVKFFLSILKLYFTWKENKQLYFKYTSKYGHYTTIQCSTVTEVNLKYTLGKCSILLVILKVVF